MNTQLWTHEVENQKFGEYYMLRKWLLKFLVLIVMLWAIVKLVLSSFSTYSTIDNNIEMFQCGSIFTKCYQKYSIIEHT